MSESVVSIQDHQKTIGQLMRLKQKLQSAEAERDNALSAKQARDNEYESLMQEFKSVKEVADKPARIQDELMQELEQFRRQTKLSALQTALDATGKVRKGVKFEQVARLKGLDLDQLTVEQIQDSAFVGELMQWAETEAPFLLGSDEPATVAVAEPEEVTGRPSLSQNVARRLPTFQTASGGGTPPPGEIPSSTARLRDPADARRRMLEARQSRTAY